MKRVIIERIVAPANTTFCAVLAKKDERLLNVGVNTAQWCRAIICAITPNGSIDHHIERGFIVLSIARGLCLETFLQMFYQLFFRL
jgi:hypothetical protein